MSTLQQEFNAAKRQVEHVKKRNVMLSTAITTWLAEAKRTDSLRPTTIQRYEELYKLYFKVIARRRLDDITREEVIALRMVMSLRMGSSGLNQARAVLAGAYKFAREKYAYDGEDPSRWWTSAKIGPRKHRNVLTPADVEKLCDAAESLRDAALYRCMAYAGLRISECRALTFGAVDFENARLTVSEGYTDEGGIGTTKGKNIRTVPIAPQLASALREHMAARQTWKAGDVVFEEIGSFYLDDGSVRRRLNSAAERAGLERVTPHLLRHSAATLFAQEFPIHTVKELLGHQSIQTTAQYLHHQARRDEAQRLGDRIGDQL